MPSESKKDISNATASAPTVIPLALSSIWFWLNALIYKLVPFGKLSSGAETVTDTPLLSSVPTIGSLFQDSTSILFPSSSVSSLTALSLVR